LKKTMDARDFTKDPPAELDVESIRRNRKRTADYLATGKADWPRPWEHHRGDWLPA
jgi:hypothetical protein